MGGRHEVLVNKEGVLAGTTDGTLKANSFLTWKDSPRNFDLRVQVRVPEVNSGIKYRSHAANWPLRRLRLPVQHGGQELQLQGMLYEGASHPRFGEGHHRRARRSWIVNRMPVKEFPAGEWHDYRVLVRGNHHQHWIDGHPTADLIDFDEKGRALDGVLAVQVHTGPAMTIEYKDFRIKHLPDDLPLLQPKDHPIPAGSLGVRPQGRLPKDWKPPVYGKK